MFTPISGCLLGYRDSRRWSVSTQPVQNCLNLRKAFTHSELRNPERILHRGVPAVSAEGCREEAGLSGSLKVL